MEPETDREEIILLNVEMKQLRESLDRFGNALLNLENNKFEALSQRVDSLEMNEAERDGAYKFMKLIGIVLAICVSILTIKSFV